MAALALRQYGVVTRAQLGAIGLAVGAIERRVTGGRLHRLYPGVYAVGHRVLTDEGRWMAAVLAGGHGAALSHAAAGAHWGIHRPAGAAVAVTGAQQRRPRPGVRFHRSRLPDDEVTIKDGIPVTTVARTLFDLAAVLPPGRLARAVNEAEVRRLWDLVSLADLLARHPRRPGAAAIRALLATPGGAGTRSELEDRFLGFLDRTGLPRPATNAPFWLGARWIEPDCTWQEQRLIVELDGYETHRTRAAYEHDRARDRALTAAGWRVMRVTWRHLHEAPELLAGELRAALGRAAAA